MKKGYHLSIIGNRYGKLIVCKLIGRNTRKRYLYECKCDCGNTKIVPQDLLTSGKTKSCGCLLTFARTVANKYPDRIKALFKIRYFSLKKRHNKIAPNQTCISFDEFINLSTHECFYCGREESIEIRDVRRDVKDGIRNRTIVSDTILKCNGIDRIDSNDGYTLNNSVTCCKHCNFAKNSLSITDFKELIIKIYEHWASK